jgi:small subunit ribosomal protein S19e
VAEKLKAEKIEKPQFVGFVKSGAGKERLPASPDFWYTRCASILRQAYVNGPIGVAKLKVRYGNRKRHVVTRHHHYSASGSIIRHAFVSLEKAGYVQKAKNGGGRIITAKGKSLLDKSANEILGRR